MSGSWDTKWGSRRVRHDPPTLSEALAAAQGFTDDLDEQAAIAAGLMGVDLAEAKAEIRKLTPERRVSTGTTVVPSRDGKAGRTVVVERKVSRRFQSPAKPSGSLPPAGRPR